MSKNHIRLDAFLLNIERKEQKKFEEFRKGLFDLLDTEYYRMELHKEVTFERYYISEDSQSLCKNRIQIDPYGVQLFKGQVINDPFKELEYMNLKKPLSKDDYKNVELKVDAIIKLYGKEK